MFSKCRKHFGDSNFLKISNCFNRLNIAASISCLLPPHCRNCTWCITSKDSGHQNQRLYSYLTSRSALCCLWLKTYIQKLLLEQGNTLRCGSHNDIYIAPHLQEWYTSAYSSISPPKKYSIVYTWYIVYIYGNPEKNNYTCPDLFFITCNFQEVCTTV